MSVSLASSSLASEDLGRPASKKLLTDKAEHSTGGAFVNVIATRVTTQPPAKSAR